MQISLEFQFFHTLPLSPLLYSGSSNIVCVTEGPSLYFFITIFVEFKTSLERTFLKLFLGLLLGVGMHFGELLEEVSWRGESGKLLLP